MKKFFSYSLLVGSCCLLISPSLLCMQGKQSPAHFAKELTECLIITQIQVNKQPSSKPKQPPLTSAHCGPKKYKNKEFLTPLCAQPIGMISGSSSSETLSSSINSDEIKTNAAPFVPTSATTPICSGSTSSSVIDYTERNVPITGPKPIPSKLVAPLNLSKLPDNERIDNNTYLSNNPFTQGVFDIHDQASSSGKTCSLVHQLEEQLKNSSTCTSTNYTHQPKQAIHSEQDRPISFPEEAANRILKLIDDAIRLQS